jgi:DnaJ-class molecular chaperone
MSDKDLYKVLGVQKNADTNEIRKAFLKLSKVHHPDKGGDAEKFKNVQNAYDVLSDESKRGVYDMTGHIDGAAQNNNQHPFGGMPFGMQPGINIPGGAKIHFFHGGPMNFNQSMQLPTPIIKKVTVNISDVLSGTTIPVEIERWLIENNTKVFECETLYVEIPKGIDDGEIIILREKGNIINQTTKGDVKINVEIKNESDFKRSGLDLILEKKITLKESLCGCSFEIKHINGKTYTLNNNSGNIIVPDYRKIIPGLGIERGSHTGNLILVFKVEYPQTLSENQLKVLKDTL